MSEFKVGDRVRLEGTVVSTKGEWVSIHMDGDGSTNHNAITRDAMAHATLIELAQEAKAPPILDTSKPMRVALTGAEVAILCGPAGREDWCFVDFGHGTVGIRKLAELENIPTPKRTASRDMVMVDDGMGTPPYILYDNMEFEEISFVGKILARGTITLTEGEGL